MAKRNPYYVNTISPSSKLAELQFNVPEDTTGILSFGCTAYNGVVLVTENRQLEFDDEESIYRIDTVSDHIGMTYSGTEPDHRILVDEARKIAENYVSTDKDPIPVTQLVQRIAAFMKEYPQTGGGRPFDGSLLICGWESKRPYLFECDSSGSYSVQKSTGLGKYSEYGKLYLEGRCDMNLELDDAIHVTILALQTGFRGQMTTDNIEIGVCNEGGFERLSRAIVEICLAKIP